MQDLTKADRPLQVPTRANPVRQPPGSMHRAFSWWVDRKGNGNGNSPVLQCLASAAETGYCQGQVKTSLFFGQQTRSGRRPGPPLPGYLTAWQKRSLKHRPEARLRVHLAGRSCRGFGGIQCSRDQTCSRPSRRLSILDQSRSRFKTVVREGEAPAEPGFAASLARQEPRPPGFETASSRLDEERIKPREVASRLLNVNDGHQERNQGCGRRTNTR